MHTDLTSLVSRPPFIGRTRELETLNRLLANVDGIGERIVTVAGEAGVGKTRLISEVANIARGLGRQVLWSQMIEDPGAPPYLCWLLALRSCVQHMDDDELLDSLGAGAVDMVDIVPELSDRLSLDRVRTPSDSTAARYQLFDSVTRFLLRIAARKSLVLLFDNLHAADRSSLALLEYFCQQIAGNPVLVVAAYRESELYRHHPLRPLLNRLTRNANHLRLPLRGLSRTEVAELLHAQVPYSVPATVLQAVFEQSDGNPLFVTEVGGMLAHSQPDSPVTSVGFRFNVPESLREVIVARLEALPDESSKLLGIAAVLGRDFDLATLADLAEISAEAATRLLQRAETAGICESQGAGRYRFSHALFREVLYGEHSTVGRVTLHRKAGEQLESRYEDDLSPHLSALAHHFFEAAQAGKEQKAIHYCQQAADAARSRRAYGEAVKLLDCALQVAEFELQLNHELRFTLFKRLGQAQYQSGDLNAATQTLMKAAILAYRHQWWKRLADALFAFQLVCQQSGNRHVSSIPLHEAVLENVPDDQVELQAKVLSSLAKAHRTAGHPDKAADSFRRSIELARKLDDSMVLLDCLRKGNWTVGRQPSTIHEGLKIARETFDLAEEHGNTESALDSIVDIVFQLCDLGEIDEVEDQLVALRSLAERERQPHFENILLGFETAVAILRGRWKEAMQGAQQGVRRLPMQGVFGLRGRLGFQIFAIKKAQGTLGQVHDVAERIIASSNGSQLWLPGQILLHCELNQPKQARVALGQLGDPRSLPRDDLFPAALAFLAEACCKLRDTQNCAYLYDLLTPYRGLNITLPGTLMMGAASGYLALLAHTLRSFDEARVLFDEALELNDSMGAMPILAWTRTGYARMLLGSKSEPDRMKANQLLIGAKSIAEELELRPVLQSINELSNGRGLQNLTDREVVVLKNMAGGASNNRIADNLNISHSTVATHIRHIFKKIGVSNRTEAVAFARRTGLLEDE